MCEAKTWVGSDWLLSSSKLQPCLQLCQFAQALLKTKTARWKAYFLLRIYEKSLVQHSLKRMAYYSRYTIGKEECRAWSLIATTSQILAQRLSHSLNLDERKSFLVCLLRRKCILHHFLCSPYFCKSRGEISFKGGGL
jgi:hypothetical protein